MKKATLLFLVSTALLFSCNKLQKPANSDGKNNMIVGFYNVENLFDTINDPKINDEDFLPSSSKKYNTKIYTEKLSHLAKVIAVFKPSILGLCEVENKTVLDDLVKTLEKEQDLKYAVSHHESQDRRGIDVAFIYNPNLLTSIEIKGHFVALEAEPDFITRDVVQLNCTTNKGETFYVFGNHWPSRRGGAEASEYKRIAAASVLKHAVADIQNNNASAKIVIMGDFNDEPFNKSLLNHLKADSLITNKNQLFNTSYYMLKKGEGTYNYKGNWNVLDQIIVSSSLITEDKKGLRAMPPYQAQVVKQDFMLYETKSGNKVPSRSFGGPNYYGGYSDHLPTFIQLAH